MVATLPFDLHGLRGRAILLVGHAGGLRSDLPEKQRLALFSGQSLRAARS
ncbi:hypothetical protein DSM14862_04039 (plasmid) [Sulfitobacter indolifex]|uniref:Uncharacterized protein n=1 Tax=Sulfitobacter indolifex HEL-45 TaxID=391624 RepID=A0ABM9X0E3_9RHOB|nr:hypothetical protein [Sulfitobacter indolifex]EDQ02929.1 hypothetical protein OIHEL45_17141 [Sulfitobacter indolifex HEL-45]UOA21199.1 hypothetical protein DSM14862_04039 [Sulfitobacter indolifex]